MKKIGVVGLPGSWSTEKLADTVNEKTGQRLLVDMEKVKYDSESGNVICGDLILNDLDAIMIKKIGPVYTPDLLDRLELLRYLEGKGMKMFSKASSILKMLDRLSCTMTLQLGNIPMPPTCITEDVDEALDAVKRYGKCVFKPLYSTKARGMTVIENNAGAMDEIQGFKSLGNPMMYIQKMIDIPGKDMGVTFLGGEYIATYARVGSDDSWNTTILAGGKYEPYEPSKEIIDLAHKAQALFDLEFTCVDVVETSEGPMIFEVSAFGGYRGLLEGNNIDIAQKYVDYVLGKI